MFDEAFDLYEERDRQKRRRARRKQFERSKLDQYDYDDFDSEIYESRPRKRAKNRDAGLDAEQDAVMPRHKNGRVKRQKRVPEEIEY